MSKFLDLYNIISCTRADNECISIVAKHKADGNEVQFIYNPNEKTGDQLSQMIYNDLHSGVVSNDDLDNMAAQVRCDRYRKLSETDMFVSIPDYPLTSNQLNEIKAYRQALRDITEQEGFPNNVVWPEVPDCIKDKVVQ